MRALGFALLSSSVISFGCAPDDVVVRPFHVKPLAFSSCPPENPMATVTGAECATLAVPLDWSRGADSPSLSLDVARLRAGGAGDGGGARIGALAFDFGGPGIPALVRLAELGPGAVGLAGEGGDVVTRFDRVAMNRRGVGMGCISDALAVNLAASPPAPDGPNAGEQWRRVFDVEEAIAAACADQEILPFADVESTARDLDALREALGEEQLNMLASSEGTRVAAEYATLFPARVRAFVLDSPALADDEGHKHVVDQAIAYDDAFARFFEWCAAATVDECPLHTLPTQSADDIAAAFDSLVDTLDRAPIIVSGVRVDGGLLVQLLVDASFAPDALWTTLATVAKRALDGDAAGLAQLNAFIDDDVDDAAFRAITAVDRPFDPPLDEDGVVDFAAQVKESAPRGATRAVRTNAGAALWSVRAPAHRPAFIGPSSAPPLLLLAVRHDPATPYAWAEQMQTVLDNGSHLVTYEGDGHTRAPDIECLGSAGAAYLADPTTPPAVTTCAEE